MNGEGIKHNIKELYEMLDYLKQGIGEIASQFEKLKDINKKDEIIDIAIKYAWKYIGIPYRWGGDDPSAGFDCSGLMLEILQGVGRLPRKQDFNAQMMWDKFKGNKVEKPYKGCLVFWHASYDPNKIIHVELCITDSLSIGASGGGSQCLTLDDAIKYNAFIKIRPFRSRALLAGFLDPFK